MIFYDFEYDGVKLSDMGFVVCSFSSTGLKTISNGSPLKLNTVSVMHGNRQELLSVDYTDTITATFQICKKSCASSEMEITGAELATLNKWLNRKEYHKFKVLNCADLSGVYFYATFNLSRVEYNNRIFGVELSMTTDRPYGLKYVFQSFSPSPSTTSGSISMSLTDASDIEGFIYPKVVVKLRESGDLTITNSLDSKSMIIKNCTANEQITAEYPMIRSTVTSHKIQNDFNWNFIRIISSVSDSTNVITSSLCGSLTVTYERPIHISV